METNKYIAAALDLFTQLSVNFTKHDEAHAYVAGGVAVSWWLGNSRVTMDLDAVFQGRFPYPDKMPYNDLLAFDPTYNDTLSLVQEDYYDRAVEIANVNGLHIHIVAPVDLVLMKISRGSPKDWADIEGLIDKRLIDKREFEELAEDALKIYIGDTKWLLPGIEKVKTMLDEQQCKQNFHP